MFVIYAHREADLFEIALVREVLSNVLLKLLILSYFPLYQDIRVQMYRSVQRMQRKKPVLLYGIWKNKLFATS